MNFLQQYTYRRKRVQIYNLFPFKQRLFKEKHFF